MGRTKPSSMTNDRTVPANRTSPRQQVQRDHPGWTLSFASGSAIKRITAGVKAPPVTVLCQSFRSAGRAFTLRLNQFRTKTRILLYVVGRQPPENIGRFKTTIQPEGRPDTSAHRAFSVNLTASAQLLRGPLTGGFSGCSSPS